MRCQSGACVVLLASLAVVGCGGGDDDESPAAMEPAPSAPQRGALLESPPAKLNSYSASQLLEALGGNDPDKALLSLALEPNCGVDVYQLKYQTVGAKAESVSASGAL